MSGLRRDPRKPRGKKPLSNGWVVVPSKTYPDRVYFYNTVTRCSTWTNPCEDKSDTESNSSSSELPNRNNSRSKSKLVTSHSKKRKSSPDKNSNIRINTEIEDYDEHDQYFANTPINSQSHMLSPPSSPESISSFKTNISDSDNALIENNKKKLWDHFILSAEKLRVKKSVALSDFPEASTSQSLEMEKTDDSDKNSNSFKKKKTGKRKKKVKERKNITEKINKTVSFKQTDKTPAQARLLKLKSQNAQKLKELAAKYPELGILKDDQHLKKSKRSGIFNLKGQSSSDHVFESGIFNSAAQDGGNCSSVDLSEEMDWEPSSEESDVRNINVFRQQTDKPNQISVDNFLGLNSNQKSALSTHLWFLVLDTNIFVSCLLFVKELRDTKVTGLGYPIIYVPWRVLQELDHLKDIKIDTVDKNLPVNVRRAISYLNENLKSKHPRIFGQSFEDFAQMIDINTFAADDEILQTCIHLQKQHGDKKVMLLTNDKNLESKAIVSSIEVYSKETFQKKYLKSGSALSQHIESALNGSSHGGVDDCLCQVKEILKGFLTMVVETEMRSAFEGDWIKLVAKKPPWLLQDVIKCLLKHWRSVFFLHFSRDARSEIELLYDQLFKKEADTAGRVEDIIKTIQRLMVYIRKSQKEKRPYLDVIPDNMSRLSDLLKTLSPNQGDVHMSSLPSVSRSYCNPPQVTQNKSSDVTKVTILFKEIWESLRGFCCSLSDIIHSSGPNTETTIQEIRLKVLQMLNEVTEIVATVKKILEINSVDINESHPVILRFGNFLTQVCPNMMPDLKNELPRCLAAFFTDSEGRSLISNALKDFIEFIQDLSKAAEYFNAQSTL